MMATTWRSFSGWISTRMQNFKHSCCLKVRKPSKSMFEIQSTKTTKWEFVVKELNQAKGAATALDTETKVKICGDKNACNASFSVRLITADAPHLHSTLRSNRHIDCTVTVRLLYKDKPPPSLRSTNARPTGWSFSIERRATTADLWRWISRVKL